MAMAKLGLAGAKNSLKDDASWYYESYQARGGPTKEMELEKELEIVGQN